MGAFAGFPVIETEALLRRDVGQSPPIVAVRAAVDVPLADETGAVTGAAEDFPQGRTFRLQFHVVDENAMGERILAREEAGAIRAAHGASRHGVFEIHAFRFQAVEHRGADIDIPAVSRRLRTPLIREQEQDVGTTPALRQKCWRDGQTCCGGLEELAPAAVYLASPVSHRCRVHVLSYRGLPGNARANARSDRAVDIIGAADRSGQSSPGSRAVEGRGARRVAAAGLPGIRQAVEAIFVKPARPANDFETAGWQTPLQIVQFAHIGTNPASPDR